MNPLKRLYSFIRPYQMKFFVAIGSTLIYTFARASQPFIIGMVLNELARNVMDWGKTGVLQVNFPYVAWVAVLLCITALIDATGDYTANYLLTEVVQNATLDIRSAINDKIQRLPVSYFDTRQQGEILSRVTNDVDTVSNAMQQGLLRVFSAALTLLFSFGFMLYRSVFFTLIAFVMLPIIFFVYRRFLRRSQPNFQGLQDALGRLNGYIQEYYSGFAVVKLFGQEKTVTENFEEITDDLYDAGFRANFAASSINPILSAITHITYIGLFLLMALTVLQGPLVAGSVVLAQQMEIGSLQAFIQYIWQSGGPISDVTQLSGIFQAAAASLTRVFTILDEEEESHSPEISEEQLANLEGNITFHNVAFGYKPNDLLMKDVSFSVKAGQMVAVVGPTGAGKTTLINLLMRFYDINSGSIKIDGLDVKNMSRQQLRSQFGMVLQDPWLYYATIADNIRFGNLAASDYQVVDAAKTANVHHFIRTLPEGYDTMLNKESSNVSQGQKQLLTIARVLVGDPKIVILDEATSSVDTRLELLIQHAMKKTMDGRTSFVIAHRLSTIRDADLILVMNHGAIVEQGTHEELLAKEGMYKDLYESQFSEEEE